MKRIVSLILALSLVLCLAAAGAEGGEKILQGWTTSPTTMNSHMWTSNGTASTALPFLGNFVVQLADENGQFQFVPNHAAELPRSEDGGKTWTVKLREGLKWTDGTPIDASTYMYSMKMQLDPKLVNKTATYLFDPVVVTNARAYYEGTCAWEDVGIKQLDDYTLQFTLDFPCTEVDFWTNIAATTRPVKEDLYESLMNADRTSTTYGTTLETTPSCGVYILTDWVIDGYYDFRINPDSPLVKEGYFKIDGEHDYFISSSATRSEMFWSNQLDYHTLNGAEYTQYKDDPRTHKNRSASVWGVFVNAASKNTVMADVNLRRALFCAAPREEACNDLNAGMYKVPGYLISDGVYVGDPLNGGMLYRQTEVAKAIEAEYGTDHDKAVEYFNKAYENNGNQKITVDYIYFDGQEQQKRIAEIMKEVYENLFGADRFELTIRAVVPQSAYDIYRAGDYDMGLGVRLGNVFNPWTYMAVWTTNYADKYILGFDNAEFDALQYDCVYGDLLNDPEGRIEALAKMERMLLDHVAFIPLMQNDNAVIYQDRVWLATEEYLPSIGYSTWQCDLVP